MKMPLPFAINGLGRVGRALLRTSRRFEELRLVGVNDLQLPQALAQRVARDSIYGAFDGEVSASRDALWVNGERIDVYGERQPDQIPWGECEARVVVESSGVERTGAYARRHLGGSVERVVAAWNPDSDPPDVDATFCMGINEQGYDPERHRVISNASCTTNCIAPLAQVLDDAFGLRHGLTHSVHSVTNSQTLLDTGLEDPRRGRSALINMIPVSSRAARSVGEVLPHLSGRLDGYVTRVPAPAAAMLDLVAHLERPAREGEVNEAFRQAATGALGGILAVNEEPLVSSDFVGETHSAVVDLPLTQKVGDHLVRVVAWYDNEWGYASRLAELLALIARRQSGGQKGASQR